jgi:hypothetical protein
MALLKLGSVVTEMRGKLGGHALQMQGGRCVAFTKKSFRESTERRHEARKIMFGSCAAAWKNMTEAQRQAWNRFALEHSDKVGLKSGIPLTGRQLFFSTNLPGIFSFSAFILTPTEPVPFSLSRVTNAIMSRTGNYFFVYFAPLPVNPSVLYIEASRPMSPGHRWKKGDFRAMTYVPWPGSSPINIYTLYNNAWGNLWKKGCQVWLKTYIIQYARGFVSNVAYRSVIAI